MAGTSSGVIRTLVTSAAVVPLRGADVSGLAAAATRLLQLQHTSLHITPAIPYQLDVQPTYVGSTATGFLAQGYPYVQLNSSPCECSPAATSATPPSPAPPAGTISPVSSSPNISAHQAQLESSCKHGIHHSSCGSYLQTRVMQTTSYAGAPRSSHLNSPRRLGDPVKFSLVLSRGFQAAAAPSPPGYDSLSLESLAELAASLWDDSREGHEGLTPSAIVAALDRHIVGQAAAKRAVAVALRNRWRRQRVEPAAFRDEIMPKNILMVGPTGCGKTEVARRLAKLADAPFVKVEATKYTELGYVGRDVEEIIKDLVEAALVLVRQRAKERLAEHSARRAEAIILRALVGPHAGAETLETFRQMYRKGEVDNTHVEIDVALLDGSGGGGGSGLGGKLDFGAGGVILLDKLFARPERPFGAPPGMGLGGGQGGRGGQGSKKTLSVAEARSRLEEAESEKLLSSEQVTREAIRAAEQDGIVFIDEIDKIVEPSSGRVVTSGGVSSEGVQRDLLPIIEGSVVPTKHGNVSTEHVLFICSGAFHSAKPSDMLAELQGRLPIRVELKGLTADDFYRILTEPDNNMIRQQQELMVTEGVQLVFTDGAVRAIASLAEQANKLLDNIGARRLHTVLERVMGEVSFSAPEWVAAAQREGQQTYEYIVDEKLVHRKLDDLLKKQDLSRYVL